MTMRLRPDLPDQRFARRVVMVVLAVAVAAFLYKARNLLLLAFGAMLVGILFSAIADWIAARTPLKRGWGVGIALLLFLLVFALIGWLFGAETIRQASELRRALPRDWDALQTTIGSEPVGQMLLDSAATLMSGSTFATLAAGSGWGAAEIVVNFIIIVIGGTFFAADPALYKRGMVLLLPPGCRETAADALDDVGRALRLWLVTQIVSMVLMGVMIGAGLWWAGLEPYAALGLLGGLSEFIPYVGPTVAMIPALVVALAGKGSVWGVLGTYAVVRIVQANVITPLISQRLVSVPPGLYLFLILAIGIVFGIFALFFSGALAVTLYVLVKRLYVRETLGDALCMPGEEADEAG